MLSLTPPRAERDWWGDWWGRQRPHPKTVLGEDVIVANHDIVISDDCSAPLLPNNAPAKNRILHIPQKSLARNVIICHIAAKSLSLCRVPPAGARYGRAGGA